MKRHNNKQPARSASPIIRALFDAMDENRLSYDEVADMSGVSRTAIATWKHGRHAPRLVDFEAVAQSIGYEITLRAAP